MWFDLTMVGLLKSPLHGGISNSVMVVTVKGHDSRKAYSTLVNYLGEGNTLCMTSLPDWVRWRNRSTATPT